MKPNLDILLNFSYNLFYNCKFRNINYNFERNFKIVNFVITFVFFYYKLKNYNYNYLNVIYKIYEIHRIQTTHERNYKIVNFVITFVFFLLQIKKLQLQLPERNI